MPTRWTSSSPGNDYYVPEHCWVSTSEGKNDWRVIQGKSKRTEGGLCNRVECMLCIWEPVSLWQPYGSQAPPGVALKPKGTSRNLEKAKTKSSASTCFHFSLSCWIVSVVCQFPQWCTGLGWGGECVLIFLFWWGKLRQSLRGLDCLFGQLTGRQISLWGLCSKRMSFF